MSVTAWLVLGVCLVGLEIFIPSFVVVWFGVAAILTAGVALWSTELTVQLAMFTLFSILSFFAGWFGVVKRLKAKSKVGQGKDSVVGEKGVVAEVRGGDFVTGTVRFQVPLLGADSWLFLADEALVVGDRVEVVDVVGMKMKVRKVA